MGRAFGFLVLTLALAGGTAAAQERQPPLVVAGVTLTADEYEIDVPTGVYTLRGAARAARSADEELLADRITYFSRTQTAAAEGNIVLRRGNRVLRAERIEYDFVRDSGRAEQVRTVFRAALIRAEEVEIRPEEWIARRASITTCPGERPDFRLLAREAIVIPDERFRARDAGVELFGSRLITLPGLSRSLRAEQNAGRRSIVPRVGLNDRDGFYLEDEFLLSATPQSQLAMPIRLGTARGPIGGLDFGTRGRWKLVATARYRDESPNQRARFLEVNRLPEVGLVWTPRRSIRPGRFLAHQIGSTDLGSGRRAGDGWAPAFEVSAGFFQQRRADARRPEADDSEGARLRLQAQVGRAEVAIGPITLDRLRLLARQSFYDDGRRHSVLGIGVGKFWRLGHLRIGAERLSHLTGGTTPFLFDDVELRDEWRPELSWNGRRWEIDVTARINADRGGLYNTIVSIAYRTDCLEPRLIWESRRQLFLLQVRVLGLEPAVVPDSPLGGRLDTDLP